MPTVDPTLDTLVTVTPEERAEWRFDAAPRALKSTEAGCLSGRILRLLDALDAAEAYRTTPELALELARVAQERAAAAEAERDEAHARGVAEERARVVAWLRSDEPSRAWCQAVAGTESSVSADCIARGDHDTGTAPAGGSDV